MKISVITNCFLCLICKDKLLRMGIPVTIMYVKLFFAIVYQIVIIAIQNIKNVYNGVFGENN